MAWQAAQGDPSRGTSSCVDDFVIFLFQMQLFSCLLDNCYFPENSNILYIIHYIIYYYTIHYIHQIHYILYCIHNIVTETCLLTVGGHRQTHFGQGLLGYHQGVRQGGVVCRQGLVFQ